MTVFGKQLITRQKKDQKNISIALQDIADASRGKSRYHEDEKSMDTARHEVETICQYYQMKIPSEIPDTEDVNEMIDYVTAPSGITHRRIQLDGTWWKNGEGAILAVIKDNGQMQALLPGKYSGYYYLDEYGNKIRISAGNRDRYEKEALCFYKPLPAEPITGKQLILLMIRSISWSDLLLILIATLMMTGIGLLTPMVTRMLFDDIIPTGYKHLVLSLCVMLICMAIGVYLVSMVKARLLDRIRGRMDNYLMNGIISRVMHMHANFFSGKTSGGLAQSVQSLRSIPSILTDSILAPGITALFSLAYIIQISTYASALALPAFIVLLVQLGIILISTRQRMSIIRREIKADVEIQGLTFAILNGIQRVRLSASENRIMTRWAGAYKNKAFSAFPTVFPCSVMYELVGAAALLGTLWVYAAGVSSHINVAQFAAFMASYGMASGSLTALAATGQTLPYLKPILDIAEPILREVPEVSGDRRTIGKIKGDIEMSHVSFRYEEDGPLILDDLSIHIREGEYVAIVGKSGCGKSTIMRLLMGFETPQIGAISYDGINMSELDPGSLRRNIGTVLQNGKLFAGDIFANITISAPWLTLEDAWEAARMAGMEETIKEMPMGMHTLISEGSGGISGGQKQRLMIARAIAPKPRILMLDEATSALDNITQKIVSDSLEQLNCTRIVVAHRLSTIRHCDRIIVLDRGQIIEDGTYEELMEANGFFAELVSRQTL